MTTPLPAQLESRFTHQTAQVNGLRKHYVIGGQGFPVVLLHGWPETWYQWRKIMPALAEKYTVIAPDSRGMGGSGAGGPFYSLAQLAEPEHVSGGIIPQCGHFIPEEQPEELLRRLNAFFSEQEE